jgi:hypothetical protein
MATNWPNSVQTFTNPTAGSALNSPSHADQHITVNDTVEALQNYAGLVLVKTQTIGSGVSSVTVTGAFSSTFDNYRIVVEILDASTGLGLRFRLGSTTTNYYSSKAGLRYNGGTFSGVVDNDATYMDLGSAGSSGGGSMTFDVVRPYITDRTLVNGTGSYAQASTGGYVLYAGFVNDNTSYTAFTFLTSTGTISNGNIRVYGYNNG